MKNSTINVVALPVFCLVALSGIALADIDDRNEQPENGPAADVAKGVALAESSETVYRGDQEAMGAFQPLFDEWYRGARDTSETANASDLVSRALTQKGISPSEQKVRCTRELCRAWFRFPSPKELYRLSELGDSGPKLTVALPYFRDGGYEVSAYWTTSQSGRSITPER